MGREGLFAYFSEDPIFWRVGFVDPSPSAFFRPDMQWK
jgi:hypothetical protein